MTSMDPCQAATRGSTIAGCPRIEPASHSSFCILRPGLALERREHASLRQRGFTHPGIAEKNGNTVGVSRERRKHLNRFALAAEEIVAVFLLHCFKAAVLDHGHPEVVDADLADYLGSIPHAELLKSVTRRIVDRRVLHLIKMWAYGEAYRHSSPALLRLPEVASNSRPISLSEAGSGVMTQ